MSAYLFFVVPGTPRPKERPRTVRVKGTNRVITFTPTKTSSYEDTVRLYAIQAVARARWPKPNSEDRFAIDIVTHLPDRVHRDGDNIEKAIFDGLIGALYRDDWQVARHSSDRMLGDPNPRVEVRVRLVVERVWPEAEIPIETEAP